MVFGQANFTDVSDNRGSGTVTANSLCYPTDICVHNGNLWVADVVNSRILRWSNAYSATINANADLVLGSSNFIDTSCGTSQNRFNSPCGVCFDDLGNLWICDNYNNRVLMFANAESKTNGANADKVLGQTDFTTRSYGVTQSKLDISGSTAPSKMTFSGSTLWIPDRNNNRVLRFDNAASKSNGANADGVLGQGDFVSSSINRGGTTNINTINYPIGLYADQNADLYVVDAQNYRVLIFENAAAKSNGANADKVLGQTDFVSHTSGLSANKFSIVCSVTGDKNTSDIFITEFMSNRVLRFSPPPPAIPVLPVWGIVLLIGLTTIILVYSVKKLI